MHQNITPPKNHLISILHWDIDIFLILTLSTLFRDPQFLIESLSARFPAQELLQDIHFLFASSALEDCMSISTSLLSVHGVVLEDGVEHVRGVDLR